MFTLLKKQTSSPWDVSWSKVTIKICNAVSTKGSDVSENKIWLYGTPKPTGSYAHTMFNNDVNIGNAWRFSADVTYWIHLFEVVFTAGKKRNLLIYFVWHIIHRGKDKDMITDTALKVM